MNQQNFKKSDLGNVIEVQNQEEWDRLMKQTGLVVTSLYQMWQGPCVPMIKVFTKLQTQISDDKILFALVNIDNIRSLQLYIGNCEPVFLLFGGGSLVGVLRGVNAPKLKKLILRKYEEELRVLKGEIERDVIKDPGIRNVPNTEEVVTEEAYEFNLVELTICIIKPDIVANGRAQAVIQTILDSGFEIVRRQMKKLTVDEIQKVYWKIMNEDYSDEIIEYMSTGLSCLIVLLSTDNNPVDKLKAMMGNKDVERAREEDPESLRAIYGMSGYRNGLHCSDSRDEALKSIALFFPELVMRKGDEIEREKECVIIAFPISIYETNVNYIIDHFVENNFKLDQHCITTITKADINHLYGTMVKYKDEIFRYIDDLYRSEFMVLALKRKNSVKTANFILDLYEPEEQEEFPELKLTLNDDSTIFIYCSCDKASGLRDYKFFFPIEVTLGIIKPDAYEMKEEIIQIIQSNGFLIPISVEVTLTKEFVQFLYRTISDTSYFRSVFANMISGPSVIMVLSKHNAIQEWRDLIGPTDPDEAVDLGPNKLRGIFGSTLIQNAFHGSSSKKEAMDCIRKIFGNIQFDHLGNLCGKLENNISNHPARIYRPESIDECRIMDVIEKCSLNNLITPIIRSQHLSRTQIAELYASIPETESYSNVKCFIEIASNIIPVLFNEEFTAFEQLESFNLFPNTKKSTKIRESGWLQIFQEELVVPETKYITYDLIQTQPPLFSSSEEKSEHQPESDKSTNYSWIVCDTSQSNRYLQIPGDMRGTLESTRPINSPVQLNASSNFQRLNVSPDHSSSMMFLKDELS